LAASTHAQAHTHTHTHTHLIHMQLSDKFVLLVLNKGDQVVQSKLVGCLTVTCSTGHQLLLTTPGESGGQIREHALAMVTSALAILASHIVLKQGPTTDAPISC